MTDARPPAFTPGTRVRIIAECPDLPSMLVGTCATVTSTSGGGITVETDLLCGVSRHRFLPHSDAAECLERVDG